MKKFFIALSLFPLLVAAQERKPNIIFILADDLGYRDCGFTGSDYYETPNIDKLAKEGMVFRQAYSGAANCTPSRACFLSGQYASRHGVYAVGETDRGPKHLMRLSPVPNTKELSPSIYNLPEALKDAGYATAMFGKWHLGDDDQHHPPAQGFDVFSDPRWKGNYIERREPEDPKGVFSVTRSACNFMKEKKDVPFFLYVPYHAPHFPLEARPASVEKFKSKTKGRYHNNPLYAACIYDLDEGIGLLLQCLDSLGLAENTLVIFTSDNGPTEMSLPAPLRGSKGSYFEGGIRVPLIVRWPGVAAQGAQNETPVINVDFYPTFLAVAGAEKNKAGALDGENLLPLISGKSTALSRSSLFWHFPGYLDRPVTGGRDMTFRTRPVTVVRKGDWKLFLYHEEWLLDGGKEKVDTNNAAELYNLKEDEGETKNLANVDVQKRDELIKAIEDWWKATGAVLPSVKQEQH